MFKYFSFTTGTISSSVIKSKSLPVKHLNFYSTQTAFFQKGFPRKEFKLQETPVSKTLKKRNWIQDEKFSTIGDPFKNPIVKEKSFILSSKDLQQILTQMDFKIPELEKELDKWFTLLKEKKLLSKENIQKNFKKWNDPSADKGKIKASYEVQDIPTPIIDALVSWAIPPTLDLDSVKNLEELVTFIYKENETWKCAYDNPEKVRVDKDLNWVGREDELKILLDSCQSNLDNFRNKSEKKQDYSIPIIYGGMGIGKTRLAHEFRAKLKVKDAHITYLFYDFSCRDDILTSLPPDNAFGLLMASHFFFSKSSLDLQKYVTSKTKDFFDFDKVMELISKLYTSNSEMILVIQMDEFFQIDNKQLLKDLIRTFADFMLKKHNLRICLIPQLIGTAGSIGIDAINFSRARSLPLLLQPLNDNQINTLFTGIYDDLKKSDLWIAVITSLGGVPRFIKYFIRTLQEKKITTEENLNLSDYFSLILKKVMNEILRKYSVTQWRNVFNNGNKGVLNMLLWNLIKKKVKQSDKLNDITIEKVADTGILFLKENKDGTFYINIPLILIRSLNQMLNLIDDSYLDVTKMVECSDFEITMSVLRILRQNTMVGLGETKAKYSDLYPNAYGSTTLLNTEVPIKQLTLVNLNSNHPKKAIHNHSFQSVPVLEYKEPTVDLTKCSHFILNVERAHSFEGLVVHTSEENTFFEGSQFKSSQDITSGNEPKPFLEIGKSSDKGKQKTIWREWNKVSNKSHKIFYSQCKTAYQVNLFIVSNKPLKNEDIKDIPPNVGLICNSNFEDYAGPFSHPSLFIKSKKEKKEKKQEEDREAKDKEKK